MTLKNRSTARTASILFFSATACTAGTVRFIVEFKHLVLGGPPSAAGRFLTVAPGGALLVAGLLYLLFRLASTRSESMGEETHKSSHYESSCHGKNQRGR